MTTRTLSIWLLSFLLSPLAAGLIPDNSGQLKKDISYQELEQFMSDLQGNGRVEVSIPGKSVEGRSLFVVHLATKDTGNPWRIFFFAQQHGDEPAGKIAVLDLIRELTAKSAVLPDNVDLWIMPLVNPDGAEMHQRKNKNGMDLNRDHVLLSQPETQTLYNVFRRIKPQVAVDCHEFTRDSRDYLDRGFTEWPAIMMDCSNNPLFDPELYRIGERWCRDVESDLLANNINYTRYYVGGVPPDEELRHSAPDIDDARNGMGTYGGLSFIIESGVRRTTITPNTDLPERIRAYLVLLKQFLYSSRHRKEDMAAIRRSRNRSMPDFIPVNYFWVNLGSKVKQVKVIRLRDNEILDIPTANFMTDLAVKRSVNTPDGYLIPADQARIYQELLERNAIPFQILPVPATFYAERFRLLRVEEEHDPFYERYGGRQMVQKDTTAQFEFGSGSLLVTFDQPLPARAALWLEPNMLYGLYQYPDFRKTVENNIIPVYRLVRRP